MVFRAAGWQLPLDGIIRCPTFRDRAHMGPRCSAIRRVGSSHTFLGDTEAQSSDRPRYASDTTQSARSESRYVSDAHQTRSATAGYLSHLRCAHWAWPKVLCV